MSRSAVANLLVRTNAFAPFRFVNRAKLPILMYHRFSEREEFGKTSRSSFEAHLSYITRHYKVISLPEAVECLGAGDMLPPRSVVITIDDGYRDFYEVAFPVLRRYGVPATLYVVTEFVNGKCWIWTDLARYALLHAKETGFDFAIRDVSIRICLGNEKERLITAGKINSQLKKLPDDEKERFICQLFAAAGVDTPEQPCPDFGPVSWEQLAEMGSEGVEVGSHTATHPILTNVDAERLGSELRSSLGEIRRRLNKNDVHFCYPNGNVSAREREGVAAAGYKSGVTTEIRLCGPDDDLFLLPRIDAEPEMHRFVQATSGFDSVRGRLSGG